jgi:hypothetical protein
VKEDEVTEESPVWMTLAFAAIAAIINMIRGDQEKWLTGRVKAIRSLAVSLKNLNPNQIIIQKNNESGIDAPEIEKSGSSIPSPRRTGPLHVRESRAMPGGLSPITCQIVGR